MSGEGCFAPVAAVVEARRWTAINAVEIERWVGGLKLTVAQFDGKMHWSVRTVRGEQPLHIGDVIVKYRAGVVDVYPFAVFQQLFEPVVRTRTGEFARFDKTADGRLLSPGDRG
jgi:hypothetical protein